MKKLLFALLSVLFVACSCGDANAQIAWPGGSATVQTLTSADTSVTVRNNLSFINYGTLTAAQTVRLTNVRGLRAGAQLYISSTNAQSGGVALNMPTLVISTGDTLTLDSGVTTIVGLFWDGSQYQILQKSTY